MVWTIALKEIRENLLSLRFVLLFLLAVVFIPSSLYTNYRAYLSRLTDQQQIEQNNRDYLRKLKIAQIFTNPRFAIDVYWPPAPTSVFAAGFEEIHPRHLVVGKNSVEYGAPLDVQSSSGLFGSIDYLFVVQFIFSLFAVLLSFDAITREKEQGTLRSILSNPVGRAVLATGKLAGGYITLAIPLLCSFLLGILILQVSGLNIFSGDFLTRAAWILAMSFLYIAVFFLMGLLVSSLVSTTYAALVLSLAIWLTTVLVLPRTASLAAQLWQPVKSRQVTWLEKVSVENGMEFEKGRALEEALRKNSGIQDEGWQKKRNEIATPFEERLGQSIRRLEDDYRARKASQVALSLRMARLSPAGAFVSFITEMADTGIREESWFNAEAERYREILRNELFSKIHLDVYPSGGISMGMSSMVNPAQLPEFRLPHSLVRDSLRGTDLAILLIWFLAAAGMAYVALARYDVR
ncbi:MAG TPA: ABC transporter permease subunit [Acidobacteriota bacterium]|nr:ABC transporter permease subunit [Acidobacteriota bacterium]